MLDGLNDAQRCAVVHDPSIPLQILAGPGSGKTKVLTSRVAYLVQHHGLPPSSICAVTFTNKAANEMKSRLSKLIGKDASQKLIMGTFHALCARFLRKWGKAIHVESNFSICDAEESKKILTKLLKAHEKEMKSLKSPLKEGMALALISQAKSKGIDPDQMAAQQQQLTNVDEADRLLQIVYEEYEQVLKQSNSLDFDDLLRCGVKLFDHKPNLAHWCRHILVDELQGSQDTNAMQYQLMRGIASYSKCMTIVGDPDQSIYGWRSADIANLALMSRDFPTSIQILLEQNYRSTGSILKSSLAIVSQDPDRIAKSLIATHEQGQLPSLKLFEREEQETAHIAIEIKRLIAYTGGILKYKDFAILLRFSALSRNIESLLQQELIPNRLLGGVRFFERMEVKDILSYLHLVDNPSNESAFARTINTPPRKIGEKSVIELSKCAARHRCSSLEAVLQIYSSKLPDISPPVKKKLPTFVGIILRLREMVTEKSPIDEMVRFVVEQCDYEEHLKRNHKDHEARWENVQELINFAAHFHNSVIDDLDSLTENPDETGNTPTTMLQSFLQASSLSSEIEGYESQSKGEPNAVTITTCHAAKGLEWPVVFVPAVEKGVFPFYRSDDIAEERRLLYVACTRAQLFLYLSHCSGRMFGGEFKRKELSPFLSDASLDRKALFASLDPTIDIADAIRISKLLIRPTPKEAEIIRARGKFDSRHLPAESTHTNGHIYSAPIQTPEIVSFARPSLGANLGEPGQTHGNKKPHYTKGVSKGSGLGRHGRDVLSSGIARKSSRDKESTGCDQVSEKPREAAECTASPGDSSKPEDGTLHKSKDVTDPESTVPGGKKRLGMGRPFTAYQPPSKRSKF